MLDKYLKFHWKLLHHNLIVDRGVCYYHQMEERYDPDNLMRIVIEKKKMSSSSLIEISEVYPITKEEFELLSK